MSKSERKNGEHLSPSTLAVLHREKSLEVQKRHDVERRWNALRLDPLPEVVAHALEVRDQALVRVWQLRGKGKGKDKDKVSTATGRAAPERRNKVMIVVESVWWSWRAVTAAATGRKPEVPRVAQANHTRLPGAKWIVISLATAEPSSFRTPSLSSLQKRMLIKQKKNLFAINFVCNIDYRFI